MLLIAMQRTFFSLLLPASVIGVPGTLLAGSLVQLPFLGCRDNLVYISGLSHITSSLYDVSITARPCSDGCTTPSCPKKIVASGAIAAGVFGVMVPSTSDNRRFFDYLRCRCGSCVRAPSKMCIFTAPCTRSSDDLCMTPTG
ncbi:hypothetical protein ARMGADRAFT_189214 [Armillaria gallica]|uniref:Uncharacterized protein n=1 Tax=Armillaria gallica TaxID=47427 RepID=A0A2H3DU87_ARMGA|nr:hypothetical protein ARMGADRAFT_189214 [Armillaria gallica]